MTTIIVHDKGEPWDSGLPSLRQKLRCPPGIIDVGHFAVNVRGFIALRLRTSKTIELRLRPSIVKPIALVKAAEILGESGAARVLVVSDDDGEHFLSGTYHSITHFVHRASRMQARRQDDFIAHRYPLGAVADDPEFGPVLAAWQAARGRKSADLLRLVKEASAARCLEVAPNHESDRLIIGAVGEGYCLYGKVWKSIAIGGRFEDMPDPEYAQWAAKGYREAARLGEPIAEDVTATLFVPPHGRVRLSYRRMILPLGGRGRPRLLLGATLGQTVTHLGFEARDKRRNVVQ